MINSIQCCSSVLKIKSAQDLVSPAQIGSIISAVFSVTESYFNDVIKLPTNPSKVFTLSDLCDYVINNARFSFFHFEVMEKAANADLYSVHHSSHEMSTLIDYFITKVPIIPISESTSLEYSLR